MNSHNENIIKPTFKNKCVAFSGQVRVLVGENKDEGQRKEAVGKNSGVRR